MNDACFSFYEKRMHFAWWRNTVYKKKRWVVQVPVGSFQGKLYSECKVDTSEILEISFISHYQWKEKLMKMVMFFVASLIIYVAF